MKNFDGYELRYTYDTRSPYRVKKIAEYAGETAGKSLSLTYGYNSTKFTDNKNRSEIYRFNNSGHLLHIHDGYGHALGARFISSGNHVNCLENHDETAEQHRTAAERSDHPGCDLWMEKQCD